MKPLTQSASLVGALERQLRLLRELSSELAICRTAYVAMDLDAIHGHLAAQSSLCDQLRQVEYERKDAWRATCELVGVDPDAVDARQLVERLEPQAAIRIREILASLALAEGELRRLNRTQSVLVEGSRRTLGVLANVLASFAPTYERPEAQDLSALANGGHS